ncbi:hypothetical protein [Caballeronia temeraria]|uniref:hypothetical protein n=1 Tax=Caballeronia temeraria TaxID=1777137 RepID=UPI001FC9167B|nr:hypothetical protein [Caballeronia temeraria]
MSAIDAQRLSRARLKVGIASIVENERWSLEHVARNLIIEIERVRACSARIERERGKRQCEKGKRMLHRPRSI